MKVTRIAAQVKDKNRYSIYVDDSFAFGISESGLLKAGLRLEQELTAEELADYKKDAADDKLYNQVLALLMRRPRSEWELKTYLKRKQIPEEEIDPLLGELRQKGYVDDEDFARRWVENRRLLKTISQRKLQLELKQKRVSDDIIRSVMAEDETRDIDVLREEVQKKRKQTRYQDNDKLMQYLARQGYRYEDIKAALAGDTG